MDIGWLPPVVLLRLPQAAGPVARWLQGLDCLLVALNCAQRCLAASGWRNNTLTAQAVVALSSAEEAFGSKNISTTSVEPKLDRALYAAAVRPADIAECLVVPSERLQLS